jgi:hypothetical protein
MADRPGVQAEAAETPSYEEIVQVLTHLVEVIETRAGEKDDRFLRALSTSLQGSLDAALRVEWAARALDDNGEILYLD